MTIAQGVINNFINGVSQQPPSIRLPTQVTEQVNAYSTLSAGLRKRPPTIHKATTTVATQAAYYHTIVRDTEERYKVAFRDGSLQVLDLIDGTLKTVATPDGVGYLDCNDPREDIRAVTQGDYTFIVNRTVTTARTATKSDARTHEALVHVVAAGYGKTYEVFIDGVSVAKVRTADGVGSEAEQLGISTTLIAAGLANGTAPPDGTLVDTSFNSELDPADWAWTVYDNVIWIHNLNGDDFTIATESETEKTHLRSHKDTEGFFPDLPTKGPNGFVIKIVGDKNTSFDDYHVKFSRTTGSTTKGTWKETVAPDTYIEFDAATMPHALIRQADGTFSFEELPWGRRAVGDEDTNAWPSFFEHEISNISFFRNRLVIGANENVILTRDGRFFNFFRETVTAILDTDPIDIAVSHAKVSLIRHMVPWNKSLLLCADAAQFELKGGDLLTPKSVNAPLFTEFPMSPGVPPVVSGSDLFFASEGTQSSILTQLVADQNLNVIDSPAITEHCPNYVPAGLFKLVASPTLKMLAGVSYLNPARIYIYKHFSADGRTKLQSAWSYWLMSGSVRDIEFIDNDLYITLVRDGVVYEEIIHCDEAWRDLGDELVINLDRRLDSDDLAQSYNAGTNRTTYTLPYPADGVSVVDAPGGASTFTGLAYAVVSDAGNALVLAGDMTGEKVYIGIPYDMAVTLSEVINRNPDGTPVIGGSLNIGAATYRVLSGYIKVTVEQLYRDDFFIEQTGAPLGDPRNLVGLPATVWGDLRVPIMAKADEVTITFESDSYLPCAVLNAAWVGDYTRSGLLR